MSRNKKIMPELRFPEFDKNAKWEIKSLGEVLIKNSTKNKNQKYSLVESVSNKFGFIKQDEYFENRRVASKDTSNYYIIKKGYFAYNPSRIDVGSLAYKHDDKTSIISPLYVSFKADNDLVDDYFLLNFFNSVGFTKQMIFEGGVRNTLNYENLIQIKIPIPNPKEQQKIASCLSSLDEVIEAHSQKLVLLKNHKKGLMQKLFPQEGEKVPKFRFVEFEKEEVWIEKKLGAIGEPLMCKRIFKEQTTNNPENNIPFYKIGTFGKEADSYISVELFKEFKTKYNYPNKGDILISASGTIGRLVVYDGKPAYFQDSNIVWLGHNEKDITNNLLYYCYTIVNWQTSDGGIIKRLYNSDLKNISISFPKNKKEQQKIASCLSALDELITAETQKIEQLQQHKKGLMQGLFPKIEK